jgi:hypothetical protein
VKKWILGFILGWIVGTIGAFVTFVSKQAWGFVIMAAGDVLWLYSMYRIIMKRVQSS